MGGLFGKMSQDELGKFSLDKQSGGDASRLLGKAAGNEYRNRYGYGPGDRGTVGTLGGGVGGTGAAARRTTGNSGQTILSDTGTTPAADAEKRKTLGG